MKLDVHSNLARPALPSTMLLPGTRVADRFRLVRQIGQGATGSVWLADHLGLGVACAIKFAEGEARHQPETVARFEREARVEAQLRSPHAVHVFDYGICGGTPFIAMEFLRGESLAARLERQRRLEPEATHRMIAHASRALMRAHALGVVHRDLKPENIFFVHDDDGEKAKLLDFGVAKWVTEAPGQNSLTMAGRLVGTPLYMSPEQARGLPTVDGRSDLWSLAIITFQCLTGRLPFVSDSLGELLGKIMFEPLPMPCDVLPWLPRELDDWWTQAAARDPLERFHTAKALSDALASALSIPNPTPVSNTLSEPPTIGSDGGVSISGPALSLSTSDDEFAVPAFRKKPTKALVIGTAAVVGFVVAALFRNAARPEAPPEPSASASEAPAVVAPPEEPEPAARVTSASTPPPKPAHRGRPERHAAPAGMTERKKREPSDNPYDSDDVPAPSTEPGKSEPKPSPPAAEFGI